MSGVRLPDGSVHTFGGGTAFASSHAAPTKRVAFAAAHVVARPTGETVPGAPAELDWKATLAFRRHLWAQGLGVAEAMDTAQRGMGLDYPVTRELIRRSAADARADGGRIVAGVGTDQLPAGPADLADIRRAYAEQLADVRESGAVPVLMCSRHLAAAARDADDYLSVYGELIAASDVPVVLHWLGEMFDPALAGYWGTSGATVSTGSGQRSPQAAGLAAHEATETVLTLIKAHSAKVDGIKVSLLDAAHEVALRRRLPAGVRLYTGDDFNYPELIRGDAEGYSDALLGIFDPIAPAASAALAALDRDDVAEYDRILAPTVPLSRHIFSAPTFYYKTGIVFLAWLAGHQDHFLMVGGLHSGRSVPHLVRTAVLADAAGLVPDPDLAAARLRAFLTVAGVDQ